MIENLHFMMFKGLSTSFNIKLDLNNSLQKNLDDLNI